MRTRGKKSVDATWYGHERRAIPKVRFQDLENVSPDFEHPRLQLTQALD